MKFLTGVFLLTFLFINFKPTVIDQESLVNHEKPHKFEGKLMLSEDSGDTWRSIDSELTDNSDLVSFGSDNNFLLIGCNRAIIYSINLNNINYILKENVMQAYLNKVPLEENRVSALFAGTTGLYAYVYGEGLFRKPQNAEFWQPISTPEGFYHVHQFKEDADGNIYIVNHYGVYRSPDYGQNWERIFQYGYATDLVLLEHSILVNGVNGIYLSNDSGVSWEPIKELNFHIGNSVSGGSVSLFEENNSLYFYKRDGLSLLKSGAGSMLLYSTDKGKTWLDHPVNTFLRTQKNVNSIIFHEGSVFCSFDKYLLRSDDHGKTWSKVFYLPESNSNISFNLLKVGNKLICMKVVSGC